MNAAEAAGHIASVLKDQATHDRLPALAKEMGFNISSEHLGSKRDRVFDALRGKSDREIAEIAVSVGNKFQDFELQEGGFGILEKGEPLLTEITRRDVAKCFGDDLSGARNLIDLVRAYFPIGYDWGDTWAAELLGNDSLVKRIEQHMIRNQGDWSVEDLFEKIGALSCCRARFAALIQAAVHPLARRGDEQVALVDQLNPVLLRDGYMLAVAGEESGYPVYELRPLVRGVAGAAKNLIFASNGPKPEIGFADAINNDIVILANETSCLVYDRPIRRDGLLWSELVAWWADREQASPADPATAKALGERLGLSLASDAERNLFATYFRLYRQSLSEALPALVPQVFLHYDPAIVKHLRHRDSIGRQRMDFLLLLPNKQRVVIEVDGAQHFSKDGKPSLPLYADMVSQDRDLRLLGYEVYRFGANELVGAGSSDVIRTFFDHLWTLHKVI